MWPIATYEVAWSIGLFVDVSRSRPWALQNGWTDRDAVRDTDLGGLKKPTIRWGPDPHAWNGNFEGENVPAQDMPGHVWRSIYSKRLSRGQNRYGADADWDVLDSEYDWTVCARRRWGLMSN